MKTKDKSVIFRAVAMALKQNAAFAKRMAQKANSN
jgi:hypothetical protein